MKKYVDLKDVKKRKSAWQLIKCPECHREDDSLFCRSLSLLEEEIEMQGHSKYDITEARKNAYEDKYFFACSDCGHIFPSDNRDLWYTREIDVLVCPKCNLEVPMLAGSLSPIGYSCGRCNSILEYCNYPHHGTGNVELHVGGDYFQGICPNCTSDENYGLMELGEQVWVEECGRVVLPLVCLNCGYRDAVKLKAYNGKRPTILRNPGDSGELLPS